MAFVTGPDETQRQRFARMVAEYEVPLLRTCCVYLRDCTLAEDAVQETFLKAYKALPAFRGACSEKTWLMRIALNTCRSIQRSSWSRLIDRRVDFDALPEQAAPERFDACGITQAIQALPIKQREVILLYYYHDMTLAEIAQALGVAVSTVGKRIKQARAHLKRLLGEEADP